MQESFISTQNFVSEEKVITLINCLSLSIKNLIHSINNSLKEGKIEIQNLLAISSILNNNKRYSQNVSLNFTSKIECSISTFLIEAKRIFKSLKQIQTHFKTSSLFRTKTNNLLFNKIKTPKQVSCSKYQLNNSLFLNRKDLLCKTERKNYSNSKIYSPQKEKKYLTEYEIELSKKILDFLKEFRVINNKYKYKNYNISLKDNLINNFVKDLHMFIDNTLKKNREKRRNINDKIYNLNQYNNYNYYNKVEFLNSCNCLSSRDTENLSEYCNKNDIIFNNSHIKQEKKLINRHHHNNKSCIEQKPTKLINSKRNLPNNSNLFFNSKFNINTNNSNFIYSNTNIDLSSKSELIKKLNNDIKQKNKTIEKNNNSISDLKKSIFNYEIKLKENELLSNKNDNLDYEKGGEYKKLKNDNKYLKNLNNKLNVKIDDLSKKISKYQSLNISLENNKTEIENESNKVIINLKTENEDLKNEIINLNNVISELNVKNKKLIYDIDNYKKEINLNDEQIQELTLINKKNEFLISNNMNMNSNSNYETVIIDLNDKIDELNNVINTKNNEIENLNKEKNKITELTNTINNQDTQISKHLSEISLLKSMINEYENKIKKLNEEALLIKSKELKINIPKNKEFLTIEKNVSFNLLKIDHEPEKININQPLLNKNEINIIKNESNEIEKLNKKIQEYEMKIENYKNIICDQQETINKFNIPEDENNNPEKEDAENNKENVISPQTHKIVLEKTYKTLKWYLITIIDNNDRILENINEYIWINSDLIEEDLCYYNKFQSEKEYEKELIDKYLDNNKAQDYSLNSIEKNIKELESENKNTVSLNDYNQIVNELKDIYKELEKSKVCVDELNNKNIGLSKELDDLRNKKREEEITRNEQMKNLMQLVIYRVDNFNEVKGTINEMCLLCGYCEEEIDSMFTKKMLNYGKKSLFGKKK